MYPIRVTGRSEPLQPPDQTRPLEGATYFGPYSRTTSSRKGMPMVVTPTLPASGTVAEPVSGMQSTGNGTGESERLAQGESAPLPVAGKVAHTSALSAKGLLPAAWLAVALAHVGLFILAAVVIAPLLAQAIRTGITPLERTVNGMRSDLLLLQARDATPPRTEATHPIAPQWQWTLSTGTAGESLATPGAIVAETNLASFALLSSLQSFNQLLPTCASSANQLPPTTQTEAGAQGRYLSLRLTGTPAEAAPMLLRLTNLATQRVVISEMARGPDGFNAQLAIAPGSSHTGAEMPSPGTSICYLAEAIGGGSVWSDTLILSMNDDLATAESPEESVSP